MITSTGGSPPGAARGAGWGVEHSRHRLDLPARASFVFVRRVAPKSFSSFHRLHQHLKQCRFGCIWTCFRRKICSSPPCAPTRKLDWRARDPSTFRIFSAGPSEFEVCAALPVNGGASVRTTTIDASHPLWKHRSSNKIRFRRAIARMPNPGAKPARLSSNFPSTKPAQCRSSEEKSILRRRVGVSAKKKTATLRAQTAR